jgi:hypothetical protein
MLGWRPRLSLPAAVRMTVDWYRAHAGASDMYAFSMRQIDYYASGEASVSRPGSSAIDVTSEAA